MKFESISQGKTKAQLDAEAMLGKIGDIINDDTVRDISIVVPIQRSHREGVERLSKEKLDFFKTEVIGVCASRAVDKSIANVEISMQEVVFGAGEFLAKIVLHKNVALGAQVDYLTVVMDLVSVIRYEAEETGLSLPARFAVQEYALPTPASKNPHEQLNLAA